jgi:transcriptional regulator of acetoin/glycerol metabolism
VAAAAAHAGNVTAMARSLGTSRSQVRRLARRYGVDLARYR